MNMKKMICALLTACLLSVSALADVIWEPNDDFYQKHYEECEYLGRSYYANGQEGFVRAFETPEAKKTVETCLENGTELYVSFTMEYEGETWGVVELGEGKTGWVLMDALMLIYDNQSFMEEHEAEFRPYDGSFEELCTSENQRVIFWSYPGSGQIRGDFETLHQNYNSLNPDVTWTDEEGRVWGHVGYYMAARGWVCLSDPGNESIPAIEHGYQLFPLQDEVQEAVVSVPETGESLSVVCSAIVLVCGVTALLIFRMKKRA